MKFPNPRLATEEGLVAVGGSYDLETLKEAYSKGIFPWPQEDLPPLWFCPDPRGILDFKDLKISKSLKKLIRQKTESGLWSVTFNTAFDRVIEECSLQKRTGQSGTWINEEIITGYKKMFKAKQILSIEIWEADDLVGGVYGVYGTCTKRLFCGESMFFKKSNASKFALVMLVEYLKDHGSTWMDIQMVTPVTGSLGGKYISREQFLKRIGV